MKQKIPVSVFFFVLLFQVFAGSISGTLLSVDGKPVADATLVLLEPDLISVTDEAGDFLIEGVDHGEYTLLIIAPAMVEKEVSLSSPSSGITLTVSPEMIEMDTIVVTADTEEPASVVNEGVTSEELERMPARSDPFEGLTRERGILSTITSDAGFGAANRDSGDNSAVSMPEGRLSIGENNEVSVYGGESDWNNYYYDYIRIPTNTHSFGYPEADAVVPVEVVDSIGIYRGAYPVEYGPGIGGLFTMNPSEPGEKWEFSVTPSVMDISGLTTLHFTDTLGLTLSVNQSILNYTVLPLLSSLDIMENESDVNESDDPTSISYGDMLMRLVWTPPGQNISLDLLGYYDAWAFNRSFDDSYLTSDYGPWYLAGGSQWVSSITPGLSNSLYGFWSWYSDRGDFEFHMEGEDIEGKTDYSTNWTSNVNSFQIGDDLSWDFSENHTLLTGVNGRFSDLSGDYTDDNLTTDEDGTVLSNYDHDITFEDTLFAAYTYAKLLGEKDALDYQIGSGLLWYPEYGTLSPSLEGEVIYNRDRLTMAFTSGWSPGVIDEFSYIDRRLDEIYYELEAETSPEEPPMAVSAAGQLIYSLNDETRLHFSPYYSWYYNLSGISMNTSYTDLEDSFVSLNPSTGYSTGFDLRWSRNLGTKWNFDISYAYSLTRYNTDEEGWVAPNTEVAHALKSSAAYKAGGWNWALNLLLYSGIPFTPVEVVENSGNYTEVQGEYNSAVDYVPVYELTTNFDYTWQRKKYDLSLFFKSSNLISGLNPVMSGLDPDLTETAGATTADFNSRNYDFSYTVTDLLQTLLTCEIGLKFTM